jgi:glycosyltransferase involved in cell wall biosynthesis
VHPKISIITPSFNQGQYLEETILSVIEQKYSNLEYIIIDGGSTDNSVEVIKKYEKHISYWVSEKDSGQSEAINKGFKKATGEIIAWLNSDDLYCSNTLADIGKLFNDHQDATIIYGDVVNFSNSGKELYVVNQFEQFDFFSRVSIHQPSVFWRRSVFKEIGLLNESLHYCMDYDFWMRLFFNYRSVKANAVFSRFREHDHSKTNANPLSLYTEYQYIVSVFFNSISNNELKNRLVSYGIYFNRENNTYTLNREFAKGELKHLFCIFIERCVNIEYTKGHYKVVLNLFFKMPKLFLSLKNISFFIKSLFFITGLDFRRY